MRSLRLAILLFLGTVVAADALALSPRGTVRALVIFARFADEDGPAQAPAFAGDLFDAALPGSLTHFFDEMSRGQFRLEGEVLPQIYVAPDSAASYLSTSGRGDFGLFTRDILAQADGDVDFGRFDSDGPDGVPNSGDDDGYVDLLLLVTQSTPTGFIVGDANGVARLGLDTPYRTSDVATSFGVIRLRDDAGGPSGTLQRGRTFAEAVGIIAHEVCHLFGLPDLYDRERMQGTLADPEGDSAGIGYWGLMGHGARGWGDRGGPTPLSAWSLQRLGWLGVNNEQLIVVEARIEDAFIGDVHAGGDVYQLPIAEDRYLLVEHRSRAGSHYDRDLPAEGVLIWHVDESRSGNEQEAAKLVDLVCADGLYRDAGFPQGTTARPDDGADNLDFYATDGVYRAAHAGNLGDATDVFDGVVYTDYSPLSNPAINGVSVGDIRPSSGGFVADLVVGDRRRAGRVAGSETWRDTIDLVGDVTIAAGGRIAMSPGLVVRVTGDGRAAGSDPRRVEVRVEGSLTASGGVLLESAADPPSAGDWSGLRLEPGGFLPLRQVTVRHAIDAIVARDAAAVQLTDITVQLAAGDGIRLEGSRDEVQLTNVLVEGVGGDGVVLIGGQAARALGLLVRDNAGHGVVRTDGGLLMRDSELSGNGGHDLWMGEGAFGRVEGTSFAGGGIGVRLDLTGSLLLQDNSFTGYERALWLRSAAPRLLSNVFSDVDTVLTAQGFRVPAAMQLNAVSPPGILVVNETDQRFDAARNWWGTTEPARIGAGMVGLVDWDPPLTTDPRLPVEFALRPNYPNPFNGATVIEFSVSQLHASLRAGTPMRLEVRTITGGLVRRIVDREAAPGAYRVVWDGRDEQGRPAASGVYFYELSVDRIRLLRRLTVLR